MSILNKLNILSECEDSIHRVCKVSQRVTIFDLWYDFKCPWYFKLKFKFGADWFDLNDGQVKFQIKRSSSENFLCNI